MVLPKHYLKMNIWSSSYIGLNAKQSQSIIRDKNKDRDDSNLEWIRSVLLLRTLDPGIVTFGDIKEEGGNV